MNYKFKRTYTECAYISILLLSLLYVETSFAQGPIPVDLPFTLDWQQNTDNNPGGGYYIYISTSPDNYGAPIDTGNVTEYTIDESVDLLEGETYYIALSVYDYDHLNESEKSDPIVVEILGILCDDFIIEAEEMSYHANGEQRGELWNLWGNGTMSESIYFSHDDTYRFEIIAKGELAYGDGPEMELIIDGTTMDMVHVDNTTPETFIFDVDVTAGDHTIAIGFFNDYYNSSIGIDRNLYVDKTIITLLSCVTVAEICDNRIDDDGDGYTDCEDIACEGYLKGQTTCGIGVCSSVGELMCSGGIEVDTCQPGTPAEDPEETCNDGSDNDCDGLTDCNDEDCGSDPACCDKLVIEAEEMSYHANGEQQGELWNLWGNGTMSESIYFPHDDTYRFEIIAKGKLAYGVGPEMKLIIDGMIIDTVPVDNTTPETFIFDVDVTAGDHTIAIGFFNDYYNPLAGIDRNLYVDKTIITLLSCVSGAPTF